MKEEFILVFFVLILNYVKEVVVKVSFFRICRGVEFLKRGDFVFLVLILLVY